MRLVISSTAFTQPPKDGKHPISSWILGPGLLLLKPDGRTGVSWYTEYAAELKEAVIPLLHNAFSYVCEGRRHARLSFPGITPIMPCWESVIV